MYSNTKMLLLILLSLHLGLFTKLFAQNENDLQIILHNKKDITHHYNRYEGSSNSDSLLNISKQPIAGFIFKWSMAFYQKIASPLLSAECIFETTCSNYSKHTIMEYGLLKGIILSADRITRCNTATIKETPLYKINPANQKILDIPSYYLLQK